MGIWVRMQDKARIEYCDSFNIITPNDIVIRSVEEHGQYLIKAYTTTLGLYSSNEKAIKVLDMIQEFIEGEKLMMDVANSSSLIKQYVNSTETKVFQMPQDNEVLV